MNQYLAETEFATQNLFALATEEEARLEELQERLRPMEAKLKIQQWDFQTSDLNDDFSDVYAMAAFHRAAKTAQEAGIMREEVATLRARIEAHQHAVQAIAGAIFQIAKQGISMIFKEQQMAPSGRMLGSLAVRDIIWQARNQSMHFEEGKPRLQVKELFSILEREHGIDFSLTAHPKTNRAKQVLDLLSWKNYFSYLADMQLLLP